MSGMGSSNNLYQQALSENKFLQMTILELKHKAALYEVCLGSISSIIKDLPSQQNINDTKHFQKMALHKIANVITHIDSVVKSNAPRSNQNQTGNQPRNHIPLPQLPQPSKTQYAWSGTGDANSCGVETNATFRHPSGAETPITIHNNPIHPIPQKGTEERIHRILNGAFHIPVAKSAFQARYPSSQSNLSTLSIHKCMKAPEPQVQSVGSMTVSPITFPHISANAVIKSNPYNSYPVQAPMAKSMAWSMPQHNSQVLYPRKRLASQETALYEEIIKKKSPNDMEMTRVDNNTQEKPKPSALTQFDIVKQAVELARAKHINDIKEKISADLQNTENLQRMTFHADPNLYQQQKYARAQQTLLSGGNVIYNEKNASKGFQPVNNGSYYIQSIQKHNNALECCSTPILPVITSNISSGSITNGLPIVKEVSNTANTNPPTNSATNATSNATSNATTNATTNAIENATENTTATTASNNNNDALATPVQSSTQSPIKVYHLPKISINTGSKDGNASKPCGATNANANHNQKDNDSDCCIINE